MMRNVHPKRILQTMADTFERNAQCLLTKDNSDFIEMAEGNALYYYMLAKPSSRFSTLLNVNREIVVLVTSFEDQQARTVKTLMYLIKENSLRVDPSVAIVVHPDSRGNQKLKQWGRENNITLLPFFFDKNKPSISSTEFEESLCRELFSYDPFDITGPVSEDQFYGRRSEATAISRQLQSGQIKSLLGTRKIGKTSLLNRIVDITRKTYDSIDLVVDCSSDSIWALDAARLMNSIYVALHDVKEKTNEKYSVIRAVLDEISMQEASALLLKEVLSSEQAIIIFADEIDYITPGSPTTDAWKKEFNIFWRNLRTIYQEAARQGIKLSLLISGVSSKWFKEERIDGVENAALAFIPEDYLGAFPRGASISMIRTLSRVVGLQFTEDAAEIIAETCADAPYWIRKACSYIHHNVDIVKRPLKVDSATTQKYIEQFVMNDGVIISKAAIQHLFRVYPEIAVTCKKIIEDGIDKINGQERYVLMNYGIIRTESGRNEISGEMMCNGINAALEELDSPCNQIDSSTELSYANISDWAEELALACRRRNEIERKLRELVKGFIIYDSMGKGSSPKERILKICKEERRKKLSQLSLDEIIDSLFWLELTNLIIKEWALFQKMFGDTKEFISNRNIINKRPDAHAKKVDKADMALYRNSLTWFESHLKKVSA